MSATPLSTLPDCSVRAAEVVALAEAFVVKNTPAEAMRGLLCRAFCGLYSAAAEMECELGYAPFVHLPVYVFAAITDAPEPAIPLAVASSLLYLGLDIFDDQTDGDLPAHWEGFRPAEISLASATLLSALPQLAMANLQVSDGVHAALQREMAAGLLAMAMGQLQDVSQAGSSDVTRAEVEISVSRKSGEEMALFAALGALLAEADEDKVEIYRRMGLAFGTAGQLASDCYDLFEAKTSKDLANGTRTLPIAMHLERLQGAAKVEFLAALQLAQQSQEAAGEVRRILREARIISRCALAVEIYCQQALRFLSEAAPREPAGSHLKAMIERVSLYGTRTPNQ